MPRRPGFWLYRNSWVTKMGCGDGPPITLARGKENRKDAEVAFDKLKADRHNNYGQVKPVSQLLVWELCERFLNTVRVERTVYTFRDYRTELAKFVEGFPSVRDKEGHRVRGESFVEGFGARKARDITPLIAEDFRNALEQVYAPKTINHFLIAAKACWNWAIRMELLSSNPFRRVSLLHTDGRERVITDEEYTKLLKGSDKLFRQILVVLRNTSSRPKVIRELTWDKVDWQNHLMIIPKPKKHRTAKIKKPWLIPIVPQVEAVLRARLRVRTDSPYVFVNEDGQPWTKDAMCLRMRRLRERVGLKPDAKGEPIVLTSTRHSFLTQAAPKVSGPMLGVLADHTDPRTTQRYLHVPPRDIYQAGLDAVRKHQNPSK